MKFNWTFIIVLSFFRCAAQDHTLPISIDLKIGREYELTKSKSAFTSAIRDYGYVIETDSVKQKYFDITMEFKNTSNQKIGIWLMKCSFKDNLQINNNYISIKGQDCDSNFPIRVQFEPGASKVYKLTLIKSIKFDYPCQYCVYGQQVETTKIGLIVIDDFYESKLKGTDYDLAMDDKSKWTIVWSNPLQLLGKQPKPRRIPIKE